MSVTIALVRPSVTSSPTLGRQLLMYPPPLPALPIPTAPAELEELG
ncbi:hypothetical protein ACF08M_38515 [Streptomyces sp. NPDC015032]